MKRFPMKWWWLLAALVVLLPGGALAAEASPESPQADLKEELTEQRAALEGAELEETFKASASEALDATEQKLDEAAEARAREKQLREAAKTAPTRIEQLEAELKAPVAKGKTEPPPTEAGELREAIDFRRAKVAELSTSLEQQKTALAELKKRPVVVGERLPAANAELSQKKAQLAATAEAENASPVAAAERLQLRAEIQALEAEVAMLGQEQTGQPSREKIAALELQRLERQLAAAKEELGVYEEALGRSLESEMQALRNRVGRAATGVTDPALQPMAEGLGQLLEQLDSMSDELAGAGSRLSEVRGQLEELERESERLRRQAELGGLEGAYAQVLLDQRRSLPDRRTLGFRLRGLDREISEAQLEGFEIEERLERQAELERELASRPGAAELLALRQDLLESLSRDQRALIQELARLGSTTRTYRDLSVEFSEFLSEQLFWKRSSPAIGARFFQDLPEAAKWAVAPGRWGELAWALTLIPGRHPVGTVLVGLVVAALLLFRRKLKQSIDHSAKRICRISTDRFVHTVRALFDTALLALPEPLLMGFISLTLTSGPEVSPWVRGFGAWIGWAGFTLFGILWLRELARDGGVGRRHFGWDGATCDLLRRILWLASWIYLSGLLLTSVTIHEEDARYFDTLGRIGILISLLGLAGALAWLFRPSSPLLEKAVLERPDRLLVRWRQLWVALLVGVPALLAIMAIAGYALTAVSLATLAQICLAWVGAGFVTYGLLLRWFMIRERRIALAEAIEARKARREAEAKAEAEEEDGSEERIVVEDEEVELDLEAVARQTRRLLRSLVGIGVIVAMSYSVAGVLPIDNTAEGIGLGGGLTMLGFLRGLLVALITWTVVKNLPGILDLAGMRESGIEPGTRYAVASLCQYAIAAIGIFWVTRELAIDWARFGWIAAALSVGLGFGLQEIVANFVCGIILLFERPIRVGDVVTVGEVTGKVSRIRMRATTITNWELQEFVVPNKEFITGSLINWTLSSTSNRVTVPVGVAYGSDTALARRILGEIVEAHPLILEDPSPLVTFEAFADSTLNLVLRFYLPNLENRLRIITEVHEEIDRRFKEAGIEIAFPQQDLHIRSVPESLMRGRLGGEETASDTAKA